MSSNLYAASQQWSSRPADERYWSIKDLYNAMKEEYDHSKEKEVSMKTLSFIESNNDLLLKGPQGHPAHMTNWSFQQLCTRCEAPAYYIGKMPAKLAVQCLNHGIRQFQGNDTAKVLLRQNGSTWIRSISTDVYSRIWNYDIIEKLQPALELGWMTPPARPASMSDVSVARKATIDDIVPGQEKFGLSVKVGDIIAPAGVYCGDRDMFIFMIHPERVIDDGGKGLMRGFFLWNSEVGKGSFKLQTFLFENVCGNHIVWGFSELQELKIVHKGSANKRFGSDMQVRLRKYADENTVTEEKMIKLARNKFLGKNKVETIKNIYDRKSIGLTKGAIEESYQLAERYERDAKAPPTSIWGFVHGLTRYSQTLINADARSNVDKAGGKLLELAMAS